MNQGAPRSGDGPLHGLDSRWSVCCVDLTILAIVSGFKSRPGPGEAAARAGSVPEVVEIQTPLARSLLSRGGV